MKPEPLPSQIAALERPDPALWRYYVLTSLLSGPFLIFTLPYLYFRYHTLRYRFDGEGIHMKVGILFRKEINLTYARIQDIHLRSGIIQRWLGLANVDVQTASGSVGTELVIEGFKQYEAIRDFLYTRMRGYQKQPGVAPAQESASSGSPANVTAEMLSLLESICGELRQTRLSLESRSPRSPHV